MHFATAIALHPFLHPSSRYVSAPQKTHQVSSYGKMLCHISCQWEEVSTILIWRSFCQSYLCHLQVCRPLWVRTSNALSSRTVLVPISHYQHHLLNPMRNATMRITNKFWMKVALDHEIWGGWEEEGYEWQRRQQRRWQRQGWRWWQQRQWRRCQRRRRRRWQQICGGIKKASLSLKPFSNVEYRTNE
jgi:hypothetical protein